MKMYPQPRRKATVLSVMERMRTDKSGKRNQGEFNFRDAMDERRRWKLTLIVTHVVGSVLKNSKDDVLDPSKKTKKVDQKRTQESNDSRLRPTMIVDPELLKALQIPKAVPSLD